MRLAFRVLGWILLVTAALLILLGVLRLPPGGLMFALPFVFFIPGFALAVLGGLLLLVTRTRVDGSTRG